MLTFLILNPSATAASTTVRLSIVGLREGIYAYLVADGVTLGTRKLVVGR